MYPPAQLYMDPYGRVVDAMGNVVTVPEGMMAIATSAPVPAPAPGAVVAPSPLGLLGRRVAGVPLWGLLAATGAIGSVVYYVVTRSKAEANTGSSSSSSSGSATSADDDDEDEVRPNPSSAPARSSNRRRWSPSRSSAAQRMQRWLSKNGRAEGTTILADADEAMSQGIKNPSPLINLKVAAKSDLDKNSDFKRWARREGLDPVRIDRTTIGLVPAENTKRGVEWEGYIDALREEGQKV